MKAHRPQRHKRRRQLGIQPRGTYGRIRDDDSGAVPHPTHSISSLPKRLRGLRRVDDLLRQPAHARARVFLRRPNSQFAVRRGDARLHHSCEFGRRGIHVRFDGSEMAVYVLRNLYVCVARSSFLVGCRNDDNESERRAADRL